MFPDALFLSSVLRKELQEIYICGFLDNECTDSLTPQNNFPCLQFHPMWHQIHLKIENRLVCISVLGISQLILQEVSQIDFGFTKEPEDEYGIMRCLSRVLETGRESAIIQELEVYTLFQRDSSPQMQIAALGLTLDQEDFLFFCMDFNGIHIGHEKSKDDWLSIRTNFVSCFTIKP